MESIGGPQCYSPLHQERELGNSSSPFLPSVTPLESCSNLDSEPRESSLGTKTTEGEDDVRTPQSTGNDRTHSRALAMLGDDQINQSSDHSFDLPALSLGRNASSS